MGSLHICAFEDVSVDPYLPANRLRIEAGNETFKSMRIGLFSLIYVCQALNHVFFVGVFL